MHVFRCLCHGRPSELLAGEAAENACFADSLFRMLTVMAF